MAKYDWPRIAPVKALTDEDVHELANKVIRTHNCEPSEFRAGGFDDQDAQGLVESTIYPVFCTWFGESPQDREDYTDLFDQVSGFAYSLAKRHVFSDGNRRVAMRVSIGILISHGAHLGLKDSPDPADNEMYQWIQHPVQGSGATAQFASYLRARIRAWDSVEA